MVLTVLLHRLLTGLEWMRKCANLDFLSTQLTSSVVTHISKILRQMESVKENLSSMPLWPLHKVLPERMFGLLRLDGPLLVLLLVKQFLTMQTPSNTGMMLDVLTSERSTPIGIPFKIKTLLALFLHLSVSLEAP